MNRQALETQHTIVTVFLTLLQEKPINRITVREITERTGISRVAFYYHFADVYDLFEKIQKQAIQEMVHILKDALDHNNSSLFEKNLLAHVEQNELLMQVLIREGLAPQFIFEALSAMQNAHRESAEHFSTHLEKVDNQTFVDYQFVYMAGGTLLMIFDWVNNKQNLSSERLAVLVDAFNQQIGLMG